MRKPSVFMVVPTAELDRSIALASFHCPDCSESMVVNASLADGDANPFCANCGGENVVPTEHSSIRGRSLLRATDDELANARCPGCSSNILMTLATAAAHGQDGVGHINCMACRAEIAYAAPSDDMSDVSDDDWIDESTPTEEAEEVEASEAEMPHVTVYDANGEVLAEGILTERDDLVFVLDVAGDDDTTAQQTFTVGSANDVVEDDDGNLELNDAEHIDDVDEDEDDDLASEADGGEVADDPQEDETSDEVDAEEAGVKPDVETASAEPTGDPDDPDKTKEGDASADGKPKEESNVDVPPAAATPPAHVDAIVGAEPMTLPLHQIVEGDVAFASYGDLIVCRRGDVVVATLEGEEAPAPFAAALNKAITHDQDLAAVLTTNGFEVASVTLTEDAVVAERARVAQEAAVASIDDRLENVGDRLKQSLGIALAGMSRGFVGVTNPLLDQVVATLVEGGMDEADAESVVATALEKAGDEFADVVQTQTLEMYDKSDDTRNELASTILKVRVQPETAAVRRGRKSSVEKDLVVPFRGSVRETARVHDDPNPPSSRVAAIAGKRGGRLF